jgi:tetraacyldisaccharide 4'-kinase
MAEGLYRAGAYLHRTAYDRGFRRRERLPVHVISIGNLTVGGSGKTPVVAWLARELRTRGRKVAVLSRGVGGRRIRSVNVVSDGNRILLSPSEVGEEPVWVARVARGVPVLAGANRTALALRARAVFGVEVVLLDDGFQHHRLSRDLDLVCLDAGLGLGNGHVLPRGPLREPAAALARADALLWTRAPEGSGLPGSPPNFPRECPQFVLPILPTRVRALGSARQEPVTWLQGARVGLLAGVARPDRFEHQLERLGAVIEGRRLFADHHPYKRGDLQGLDAELTWITTSKDAVKIPAAWAGDCRVWVLEEEVRPVEEGRLLAWIVQHLDAGRGV